MRSTYEPLLEDVEIDSLVVDITRTPTNKISFRKSLRLEIRYVISLLEAAQVRSASIKAANQKRHANHSSLFAVVALICLISPNLYLILMWDSMFTPEGEMKLNLESQIESLYTEKETCNAEYKKLKNIYDESSRPLHQALKNVIANWWGFSRENQNCEGMNKDDAGSEAKVEDKIRYPQAYEFNQAYWCQHDKLGEYGNRALCIEAAAQGCAIVKDHANVTSVIATHHRHAEEKLYACHDLDQSYRAQLYRLHNLSIWDRANSPYLNIGMFLVLGAILILGTMAFASSRLEDMRKNCNKAANLFMRHLQHPQDAARVINLMTRLNIPFNSRTQISALIIALQIHQVKLESLWQRRFAFLSGVKDENCNLFTFFNTGGNRDVKNMILEEAGLGPMKVYP